VFVGFLRNSLIFIKWTLRKMRVNFTYTFVFGIFILVLFFNFMDSSGRVSIFNLDKTGSEVFDTPVTYARAVAVTNSHNKDALIFDQVETKAKGGPSQDEYTDVNTTGNDALMFSLSALTTNTSQNERDGKVVYVVKQGDTISKIAAEYGVTINTILWANKLRASSYIKKGQELEILPVTGVKHIVKKGDTVSTLVKRYKAKQEEVISFNSLPADGSLQVGDELIIPDGEMPRVYARRARTSSPVYARSTVNANKYFIFPTRGTRTQGLHGYNAVDVGNKCGTPIYAAADGVVELSRTTKSRARLGASVFGGYGNHIRVRHPNGTVTLYAHLRSIFVSYGQTVKQGQQIATMGGGFEYVNGRLVRMRGAGKSTGCHLHFEVRGASNPLTRYWRY
jgi:murein DD-endopeptidase MepM/ murein hydrolase activator NlpD